MNLDRTARGPHFKVLLELERPVLESWAHQGVSACLQGMSMEVIGAVGALEVVKGARGIAQPERTDIEVTADSHCARGRALIRRRVIAARRRGFPKGHACCRSRSNYGAKKE